MTADTSRASLVPYVMVQDIEPAIAFVQNVFGAQEVERGTGSAGGIHCELRIGDARLMFGGAVPGDPVTPRLIGFHVYVDDVDAVFRRAVAAGATSLGDPADRPYGERSGFVADPAGNHWYVATRSGPTYFAQEPRAVTPHLHITRRAERGAPEFLAFAEAAFGARVELRQDGPEGLIEHAVLRIQGDALELGEGREWALAAPSALVLYGEDCDAAYRRALRAGARSLFPPAPQPSGGQMAGVTDAWDTEWYITTL